jgi:hypothetical protein
MDPEPGESRSQCRFLDSGGAGMRKSSLEKT